MNTSSPQQLYTERLQRYVTTLRNGKADRIPIRPFVAEFAAKYAGYNCQQVTHDYELAFEAARRCAKDFDWDAVVGNMVYVWTGLTQALGLKYYAIPGIHLSPQTGFQYREPSEDRAYMGPDEYDDLIADPVEFLFNTWLPRVSQHICGADSSCCEPTDGSKGWRNKISRNNLALVKGGMAMWNYFMGFGRQNQLLKNECGTVSAIAGILKAPFDILADKLRGYIGLAMDLRERPDKVLAACQALAPHLLGVALSGADPDKNVPITIWMHRGCVPFISHAQFDQYYWATLRPIIEAIWQQGHQTLFYAEGNWNHHLSAFLDLPAGSIIYHGDKVNLTDVHRVLGHKFCLSGGIPNTLLAIGSQDQVRDACKRVIDEVAAEGGYIMDASAIIQNDALIENVRAMTEFTREYGVYSPSTPSPTPVAQEGSGHPVASLAPAKSVCLPWGEVANEYPSIQGDADLVRRIWDDNEFLAYLFIWHCLLSF